MRVTPRAVEERKSYALDGNLLFESNVKLA